MLTVEQKLERGAVKICTAEYSDSGVKFWKYKAFRERKRGYK